MQEFLEANATLDSVSVSVLAKHLKLDKGTVSRRVRVALKAGYLKNDETQRGKPAKLSMGDPLPEDRDILPRQEVLQ